MHNSERNISEEMFFAAYVGPSMNPTLKEPEVMEIVPYNNRPFHVGDVAFFIPPDTDQPIVHRIIHVNAAGISTLGDNNTQKDSFLLQPKHIKGQVVAALRGQKRRKIAGGLEGWLISRWLRGRRVLDRGISPMLHPLYQALSYWKLIAWVLPFSCRPRVVVFRAQGCDHFKLLLGKRVIGRYDDQRCQWQIQRPFKLFVDARVLPMKQDRLRFNRQVLIQRQRTMNNLLAQGAFYNLSLADGNRWEIIAENNEAAAIVSQMGRAMQLSMTTGVIKPINRGNICRLLVQVDAHTSVADCYVPLTSKNDGVVGCVLSPCDHLGGPYDNLVRLSLIFARQAQACGGVLIHGALAERDGVGVILTAPGGTGKTTASNRFPAPWRSLSDDTTLVVKDAQGNYWAHPWPTWSRFLSGGPGGTWDVQKAVPVKGIFFLTQAIEDRVERIGPGHAVSLLGECVGQVSMYMEPGLFKEELRVLYLERFNNLCALAKVIPIHVLHITLTGAFWKEIERTLEGSH